MATSLRWLEQMGEAHYWKYRTEKWRGLACLSTATFVTQQETELNSDKKSSLL